MNPLLKDYLTYTRAQRRGIFVLLLLIVLVQTTYLLIDISASSENKVEKARWLALQSEVDSAKAAKKFFKPKIYPFNPNFITDFKGYRLGMSVEQIDRLLAYRKQGEFVNSAAEFQQVTKVSDSLLAVISPYFKFPEWVTRKSNYPYSKFTNQKKEETAVIDINHASQDDLIKVYGIGQALSQRILKQKELLGGFISMKQLEDIWGLSPDVVSNICKRFSVVEQPQLKKININTASVKELAQFPYFKYAVAKQIVTYRSMNGDIKSANDLLKINGFPTERAEIIALYLDF